MARTDLIADTLTKIRNAVMAKKDSVVVVSSRMNNSIIDIMKAYGYIENYRIQAEHSLVPEIKVYLKYDKDKKPGLRGIKRISTPGLRKYFKAKGVPYVLRGYGIAVVSTPKGVMTNAQAKEQKLGGEVICYIW